MRLLSAFILVCVLSPEIALGAQGFLSGNQLYERCVADMNTVANSYCIGYVAGIADVLSASKITCASDGVTVGQVTDIVVKYLRDHPEKRHYAAQDQVGTALMQAFPCQR
jgi:hypothetical protein